MSATITLRGWAEGEHAEAEVAIEGIDYPGQVTAIAGILAAALGIEIRCVEKTGLLIDSLRTPAFELLEKKLREMDRSGTEIVAEAPLGAKALFWDYGTDGEISNRLSECLLRLFPGECNPDETWAACAVRLLDELSARRRAERGYATFASDIRPITLPGPPVYLSLDGQTVKDVKEKLERLRAQSREMIRDAADRRIIESDPRSPIDYGISGTVLQSHRDPETGDRVIDEMEWVGTSLHLVTKTPPETP